jgi:hypothetical protein
MAGDSIFNIEDRSISIPRTTSVSRGVSADAYGCAMSNGESEWMMESDPSVYPWRNNAFEEVDEDEEELEVLLVRFVVTAVDDIESEFDGKEVLEIDEFEFEGFRCGIIFCFVYKLLLFSVFTRYIELSIYNIIMNVWE